MVSVQILDERDDVHAQSVNERSDLLRLTRLRQEVDHLLDSPRSVHVQADTNEIAGDRVDDGRSLLFGRVLEQLLAQVVSKGVGHEFREVAVSLGKDHVAVRSVALFELLLEVSASVLVLAQGEELALEILDTHTSESVDCLLVSDRQTDRLTHTRGPSRRACSSSP